MVHLFTSLNSALGFLKIMPNTQANITALPKELTLSRNHSNLKLR
jgi:hypothetical protein